MRTAKVDRRTEYFPILGGEIKATNDAQGIIEGYLNYIGNIDYGDDRTMKGAFHNTIRDSYARKSKQGLDFLWPYLFNHDYSHLPPGGIFDADETSRGLYISRAGVSYTHPSKWARCASKAWDIRRCKSST